MLCGTQNDSVIFLFNIDSCNPFEEDCKQRTAFESACEVGDLPVAKAVYQLMQSQDGAKAKSYLSKALFLACQHGHLDVIKTLVEEFYADINQAEKGIFPLTSALRNYKGRDDVVLYMLGRSSLKLSQMFDQYHLFKTSL